MCAKDTVSLFTPFSQVNKTVAEQIRCYKFKIKFELPFMVPDLVCKFQMIFKIS